MSSATSGNDREGRSSRSWSLWPSQMLCVSAPSSSGSRSPRSPGFPSWRHHAQTTFIVGRTVWRPPVVQYRDGPAGCLVRPIPRGICGDYLTEPSGRQWALKTWRNRRYAKKPPEHSNAPRTGSHGASLPHDFVVVRPLCYEVTVWHPDIFTVEFTHGVPPEPRWCVGE